MAFINDRTPLSKEERDYFAVQLLQMGGPDTFLIKADKAFSGLGYEAVSSHMDALRSLHPLEVPLQHLDRLLRWLCGHTDHWSRSTMRCALREASRRQMLTKWEEMETAWDAEVLAQQDQMFKVGPSSRAPPTPTATVAPSEPPAAPKVAQPIKRAAEQRPTASQPPETKRPTMAIPVAPASEVIRDDDVQLVDASATLDPYDWKAIDFGVALKHMTLVVDKGNQVDFYAALIEEFKVTDCNYWEEVTHSEPLLKFDPRGRLMAILTRMAGRGGEECIPWSRARYTKILNRFI